MKILKSYLKSAKFKISDKYKLKYFGQVEKIFIFFIFIFHFHFQFFCKFLNLLILTLWIIFSTRYYFYLYIFSLTSNYKNAPTANFFEIDFFNNIVI